MSDDKETGKRSRPNAAYRLSEKNPQDEELNFRYSREARLAKAPAIVRDLYDEKKKPKFSLIGPLIGSRSRAMMFGSIVFICAALIILMIFDPSGAYDLEGNRVEVQALKYEGTIIVVLKKTARKNVQAAPYTGTVDIGASAAVNAASGEESLPVFYHRIFFTEEPAEEYRFSVPFESDAVLLVLQTEKQSISMNVSVE